MQNYKVHEYVVSMEFSAVNRRRLSRKTPLGPGAKKDAACFHRLLIQVSLFYDSLAVPATSTIPLHVRFTHETQRNYFDFFFFLLQGNSPRRAKAPRKNGMTCLKFISDIQVY